MQITLNGQTKEISAQNIQALVSELRLDNVALVAEHNGEIARKENWSKIQLKENDNLELIKFCGGG